MFEDKLLYFYKSGLSYWHLAIKHFLKRFFVWFIIVAFVFWFFMIFLENLIPYYVILVVAVPLTQYFICMKPIWKYTEEKYGCVYPDRDWDIFLCAALKRYLNKEVNADQTEESLVFLISRLSKRLESKSKTNFLSLISNSLTLTLAFFIPVWSAFNTWWFTDVNDITDVFQYMLWVIVVPFLTILLLKGVFWNFLLKDIADSEVTKLSSLIEKLEIIQFSIKNPYYYKKIDQYLNKKGTEIDLIINEFDERYKNYASDPLIRFYKNVKLKLKNKKFNKIKSFNKDVK
ncbi:hypothetical protein QNH16_08985 [Peribacillus frigoritolerans]|uniref:hypothetical protein n=1 Tax=Peribacillus frigoritolerans TaxID=450367 RepID=UPI0024C043BE|nr:hypothetical protein [Peribacillus frigoritolerans]WHY15754.1 hypothetical protein QNH16_08985 [Peribacillus frigoritolerans]